MLVLVVFPRSRLCLFHENDNRLECLKWHGLLQTPAAVYEREKNSGYPAGNELIVAQF